MKLQSNFKHLILTLYQVSYFQFVLASVLAQIDLWLTQTQFYLGNALLTKFCFLWPFFMYWSWTDRRLWMNTSQSLSRLVYTKTYLSASPRHLLCIGMFILCLSPATLVPKADGWYHFYYSSSLRFVIKTLIEVNEWEMNMASSYHLKSIMSVIKHTFLHYYFIKQIKIWSYFISINTFIRHIYMLSSMYSNICCKH